jgi:uncharacterized RDD family membrane protein YckC
VVTTRLIDPADVLWRRVGAAAIDVATVATASMLAWWASPGSTGPLGAMAVVVAWLVGVLTLWQGITGRTPGKVLVGIRTVDASGDPPGVGRAALRTTAWAIDAFPYVVPGLTGYAAAFGSTHHQRVGDRLAGTFVIDDTYLGHPPFALAVDADGHATPVEHLAAYLPSSNLDELRRHQFPDDRSDDAPDGAAATADGAPQAASPAAARAVAGEGRPSGARLSLPPGTPAWDDELGAFTRRDARGARDLAFDETRREWVPVHRDRRRPPSS